jgi:membrane-associated phospholipid phosphatase
MLTPHGRKTVLAVGILMLSACADQPTAPPQNASAPSFKVTPFSAELLTPLWQEQARNHVRLNARGPADAGRIYAALSIAQYRAIMAVDQHIDTEERQSSAGFDAGGRARYEAHRGAVSAASALVLNYFFPAVTESDVPVPAGPGQVHSFFARGRAIGTAAGMAMRTHLDNDGFSLPWTGTLLVGPGYWTGTPVGANLAAVTPYVVNSTSQFRSAPHPAYLSAEFNAALNEVLTISQTRTQAQIDSARIWAQAGAGSTPLGYWNIKAAEYIDEAGNYTERKAAHVFALMHAAQFDAQLTCFDGKYFYQLLRPNQANPAITISPPITQPSYPAYPSGHACISSSAARVLEHFFCSHITELRLLVAQAGRSRLLAGIHYMFDMEASWVLGVAVADWAIAHEDRL